MGWAAQGSVSKTSTDIVLAARHAVCTCLDLSPGALASSP